MGLQGWQWAARFLFDISLTGKREYLNTLLRLVRSLIYFSHNDSSLTLSLFILIIPHPRSYVNFLRPPNTYLSPAPPPLSLPLFAVFLFFSLRLSPSHSHMLTEAEKKSKRIPGPLSCSNHLPLIIPLIPFIPPLPHPPTTSYTTPTVFITDTRQSHSPPTPDPNPPRHPSSAAQYPRESHTPGRLHKLSCLPVADEPRVWKEGAAAPAAPAGAPAGRKKKKQKRRDRSIHRTTRPLRMGTASSRARLQMRGMTPPHPPPPLPPPAHCSDTEGLPSSSFVRSKKSRRLRIEMWGRGFGFDGKG